MTVFVQRANGVIVGVYANRQDGYAEEELADDDAEILAFLDPPIPDRVSSRQFKMQLFNAGLKAQVETWVASQGELIQIAYADSGTFLRTEPMMQTGFAALGFTPDQIDAFYVAAAAL